MKCLSFAGRQREGRSGEPGLPSILLPAAVETKSRTIIIAVTLPWVPRRLRSEQQQRRWGGWVHGLRRGCQAVRRGRGAGHLPFSVIRGHKLSPWAVLDAWETGHSVGVTEPRGISGASVSFVLQQNASYPLQIATDVAEPSSTGNRGVVLISLPSLHVRSLLAACKPWGSRRGCPAAWNRSQSTAAVPDPKLPLISPESFRPPWPL